jgi:hypothetical protein
MTLDLEAAEYTLSGLRPFPVAITTVSDGRPNGLMSLSGAAAASSPRRRGSRSASPRTT